MFTWVGDQYVVVADSYKPVVVVPLLVEAVGGGHEYGGGEDGGGAHEVRLAALPPQEEGSQPREGAIRS